MALDPASLDRLCELARLTLAPAERERLGDELERVLELFAALKAAPADGLAPLSHPHDVTLRLREDRVSDGDSADALLALAPEAQGGYFLVPKVLE
ncbi:MAG TPA: Asp-tRNA(Asn)/Glu-tRNA(Gln) amidotransferase subunit GatC [Candidatus Saccharimonadia bacterium]|nr:Asp-tRNA(Asn)/Glu-tRNA(Gln) amidotransferase subunit GatC [Candidatus Saccharimonadia bacterium]